jgi:hypothetical protein
LPENKTGAGFRWRIFPTIKGPEALAGPVDVVEALVAPVALADGDVVPVVPVALEALVDAAVATVVTTAIRAPRTCTRT